MKLSFIAQKINANIAGKDIDIENIASFFNSSHKSIVLLTHKKYLEEINTCVCGAVLTSKSLSKFVKNHNLVLSDNPKLAFAKLTQLLKSETVINFEQRNLNGCFFYVGSNVKIGNNVRIGCNVIIENNVTIGDNVKLNHNVVIHSGCIIGKNVIIDSGSIIGSEGFGNVQDDSKKWIHINHLGNVIIEDDVHIGANCTIDRGTIDSTIVKTGSIIDNQVHIAHNVIIGSKTAIAAKVGIAGSCEIGRRNMIGGMVGIVDHIKTGDDVIISATSSVTEDLIESGVYTGIMPIAKHFSWKRIAFWITKLDKIVKKINIKKI